MIQLRSFYLIILFSFIYGIFIKTSLAGIIPFQPNNKGWSYSDPFKSRVFIKNFGQLDNWTDKKNPVLYYLQNGNNVLFTKKGIIYRLVQIDKIFDTENSKQENIDIDNEEFHKKKLTPLYIFVHWEGCNSDVQIEESNQTDGNYTFGEEGFQHIITKGYKKITYKNMYPGIDIEYTIPENNTGIKYSILIKAGADINQIKMNYTGDFNNIETDKNGNIKISTEAGDIIDHAPYSYYEKSSIMIPSSFCLKNQTIQFKFSDKIDNQQNLIIDPWTVFPSSLASDNCAYDVNFDNNGNVYVAGGTYPMKISKYTSTGIFQWTYTVPSGWSSPSSDYFTYAKFCIIPNSGSIFLSEGFNPGAGPRILKINNAGLQTYTSTNLSGTDEIWQMFYNNCTGQLVGFGGGIYSSNNLYLFADTNISNYSILNFDGITNTNNDICSAKMDQNGDFYALLTSYYNPTINNHLMKSAINSGYNPPVVFDVNTNSSFKETVNNGIPGFLIYETVRANALSLNSHFVFTFDGKNIKAWDKSNGTLLGSVITDNLYTTGKDRTHEGIAVDECNNVFVGGTNKIFEYHFDGNTFNLLSVITSNIPGEVFDIQLNSTFNNLFICGDGFLTTLPISPCDSSLSITNTTSSNCSNGTASVNVSGGIPPYNYYWSNGATTSTITAPPGTYYLTVTDNSCNLHVQYDTVIISPILSFTTQVTQSNVNCYGDSSGIATIIVSGGTTPYSYLWNIPDPPQTSATATGLPAGTWSVEITDGAGCSEQVSTTIEQPSQMTLTTTHTNVSCYNGNNATATVTPSGGTPPYTYLWNNPPPFQTTPTVVGLTSGLWNAQVTDSLGCQELVSISISQPTVLFAIISNHTNVSCYNENNGSASVSVSGGTGSYSYLWNNPPPFQTTQNATNLPSGTWNVQITDSLGCSVTTSVIITQPASLTAIITHTDASCFGYSDGTASVITSGGTPGYNYLWNIPGPPQTSSTVTNLAMGTWEVLISDSNNCNILKTVTITESPELTASISKTDITCFGENNGTATTIASGGKLPYTYQWNDPLNQTNPTATGLSQGTYNVIITDSIGCSKTDSVNIIEPFPLNSEIITIINVSCFHGSDGEVSINIFGGTPPLNCFWDNGQTGTNIQNLSAGNYLYYIKDSNNCIYQDNIEINEPNPLVITTTPDFFTCSGSINTILINAIGGTPPYTYFWNSQVSTQSTETIIENNTTYYAHVIDANNCSSNIATTNATVYPPLFFNVFSNIDSVCPNEMVLINGIVSGGSGGPYLIKNNLGNVIDFPYFINPDHTEQYTFYASDNCESHVSSNILINVFQLPQIFFTSDIIKGCSPLKVNFIEHSSQNEQNYLWNFGNNDVNNLSQIKNPTHIFITPGNYDVSLTVTSNNGCKNTFEIHNMITVYPHPEAYFIPDPNVVSIIDPIINFNNYSLGANSAYWDFGDQKNSGLWNPTHKYSNTGKYRITLIANSVYGCKDTATAEISIQEEFTFFAPTAFSPNNDGINDYFQVFGNGIDPAHFHLYIYDRWGEIIFETIKFDSENSVSEAWNGKIKNHVRKKTGTYVWYVNYKNTNGKIIEKAGQITLIE